MLKQAVDLLFDFTDDLKTAVLNNYLVNPTGEEDGWYEPDLLQEHLNLPIKVVQNARNLDFDSEFVKDVVALNVKAFFRLQTHLRDIFGISRQSTSHTEPLLHADINRLGAHYLREEVLVFRTGRTQPFRAHDAYEAGFDKLDDILPKFLADLKASL